MDAANTGVPVGTLDYKFKTTTGYTCDGTASDITPAMWKRMNQVLNGTDPIDDMMKALREIAAFDAPINIVDTMSVTERQIIEIARAALTKAGAA